MLIFPSLPLQIESVAQGAAVGFKKRRTVGAAEGRVQSEQQVVRAEAKEEIPEASAVPDNTAATLPAVSETVAAVAGPVSMKIITNAGGKRKFRQRAPSPP